MAKQALELIGGIFKFSLQETAEEQRNTENPGSTAVLITSVAICGRFTISK
jgi:hypothetical protein